MCQIRLQLLIQNQIRVRNQLYKLHVFHRLPTNENWFARRWQRNKVTVMIMRAVKDFCFVAAFNSSYDSSGLFWERINRVLPNTKLIDNSNKILVIEGGSCAPDPSRSTVQQLFRNTLYWRVSKNSPWMTSRITQVS